MIKGESSWDSGIKRRVQSDSNAIQRTIEVSRASELIHDAEEM
jgi:hypothetical protein